MDRASHPATVHDSTIVDSARAVAEDGVTDVSGEAPGVDVSSGESVHDAPAGVEPVGDVSEDGPVAGDGAPVEVGARDADVAEQRAVQTEPVGNAEPEVASSPDDMANTTPGRDAVAGDEGPGTHPDTGWGAWRAEAAFVERLARLTGIFDSSTVDLSGGIGVSIKTRTSLGALAQAVNCDTAETVRWEIAETLDKCSGTKERLLEQMRAGEDCDRCPPGFLAVVMQAENLARALGVALDLLGVPTIDGAETT